MKIIFLLLLCNLLIASFPFTPLAKSDSINVRTLTGQTIEFYKDCQALVVGVENYAFWPEKTGAIKSARDVSWELRRLGFSVRLLLDPSAQKLRFALNEFAQKTGNEVERGLVFYYAGHSETRTSANGQNVGWIIPVDASIPKQNVQSFQRKAISTEDLAAISSQIRSKHTLFIFDTPLSANEFKVEPAVLRIVGTDNRLPSRQFITAGSAEKSNPKGNPFTKFLILGLREEADLIRDGVVTGSELGLYLSDRISKVTAGQLYPQYGRIAQFENNRGDYVFQRTDRPLEIARLFVTTKPAATIRIMNIKPRFEQGIELQPGKYWLEVSAKGYETVNRWVGLAAGEDKSFDIQLSREQTEMTNSLGMQFVRIRPGQFMMGSPANESGRSSDETVHRVKLTRPFFMQTTEVTVDQFRMFVRSSGYRTEAERSGGCWIGTGGRGWGQKRGTSWEKPGVTDIGDSFPATCIAWNDAREFARWLSKKEGRTYRLPSEAEWEYAGRAGTSTPFSTGRCLSTQEANYGKIGHHYQRCTTVFKENRGRPLEAGALAPNPWGLYNIHGNVSEWCQDWYGLYSSGNATNPRGPKSGSERVMRGGHWLADAAGCRSAKRWRFPPNMASDVVGFRLVLLP